MATLVRVNHGSGDVAEGVTEKRADRRDDEPGVSALAAEGEMTAKEIRDLMDNVASAGKQGIAKPGDAERMGAMMLGEIAAQLAELNSNFSCLTTAVEMLEPK